MIIWLHKHHYLDEMGAGLEDVGPDVVHEVREGVLAAEAEHAQRHVLHRRARRLPVHQVAANKYTWMRWLSVTVSLTRFYNAQVRVYSDSS